MSEKKNNNVVVEILNNKEVKSEIDKKVVAERESLNKLMKEKLSLISLAKNNDIEKFDKIKLVASKKYEDLKNKISSLDNNIGKMNRNEVVSIKTNLEELIELENGLRDFVPSTTSILTPKQHGENSLPNSIEDILRNPESFDHCKYRDGLYKTSLDEKKYDPYKIGDYTSKIHSDYMREVVLKDYDDMISRNNAYSSYSVIK